MVASLHSRENMPMIRIGFICPTFNEQTLHAYTLRSLRSFFKYTAGGVAIVVDDASDGWNLQHQKDIETLHRFAGQEVYVHRFEQWGGLTRSWNYGLHLANELNLDYVIAGNNDILFTTCWYEGLLQALENGYELVGPLSNAPGTTSRGHADVFRYVPDYQLTDDATYLNNLARQLKSRYSGTVVPVGINGFFMLAKNKVWQAGRYDAESVFRPSNTHNSQGYKNLTPLMTLNEDELQGRWTKMGWKSAVVPSSFIFHYRAVSREGKHRKGKWFRLTNPAQDV